MRVLHVTYTFLPDPPGGTEVYVDRLCRDLRSYGITSIVAAPGTADTAYDVATLPVRRFACAPARQSLDALYGAGDVGAGERFAALLDRERPDIVHQHALSPACSPLLIRAAHARGLPLVFTYHTPSVSCQRGTLLQFGRSVCAGTLGSVPCAACVLDSHGLRSLEQHALTRVPAALGRSLGAIGLSGGVWTALRLTALMERRVAQVREVFDSADHLVAPSAWVAALLERNGVLRERITLAPHGVTLNTVPAHRPREAGPARFAFAGRLDSAKGLPLLVRALRRIPDAALRIDVFAIAQPEAAGLARDLEMAAARDPRLRLLPAVAHEDMASVLTGYDALLVPSQTVETGPLVVLEARAARVPVIGSALGGIADNVVDGTDGWLVQPHDSDEAWAAALVRAARMPAELAAMRARVRPVRSGGLVARDMSQVYAAVLERHRTREVVAG